MHYILAVLVDRHKTVYRKVNIGRLESGPIHGYIFWELAGKFKLQSIFMAVEDMLFYDGPYETLRQKSHL
jgi:hypothetical protein